MLFKIWGIECNDSLYNKDKIYLLNLPKDLPRMQWICDELDRVWGALNLIWLIASKAKNMFR